MDNKSLCLYSVIASLFVSSILFHLSCNSPTNPFTTPPRNLSIEEDTLVLTKGSPVPEYEIVSEGSVIDSFTISADLPAGLLFDNQTGAITGVPLEVMSVQQFTIVAWNKWGSDSVNIFVVIKLAPPISISYSEETYRFGVGQLLEFSPTLNGDFDSLRVFPLLPQGLQFDNSNGTVSGAASEAMNVTTYKATGVNQAGSVDGWFALQFFESGDTSATDTSATDTTDQNSGFTIRVTIYGKGTIDPAIGADSLFHVQAGQSLMVRLLAGDSSLVKDVTVDGVSDTDAVKMVQSALQI